uniref:Uncharacterized protein n=1 Tax=Vespula pensylvanica TaxID=30213 RepID=A0A834UB00_VESPE|nr:hypothetical protein H0235_006868 [Vespula pensylvanica]
MKFELNRDKVHSRKLESFTVFKTIRHSSSLAFTAEPLTAYAAYVVYLADRTIISQKLDKTQLSDLSRTSKNFKTRKGRFDNTILNSSKGKKLIALKSPVTKLKVENMGKEAW